MYTKLATFSTIALYLTDLNIVIAGGTRDLETHDLHLEIVASTERSYQRAIMM
jgi:hypothetical protein